MLIDLETLEEDKLNLIPFSIRIHAAKYDNNIIDTDKLPYEIAYELLKTKIDNIPVAPYVDSSTVDITPELSVYTDFKNLVSKKEAIVEYIKNYFKVDKGDYPFDPTFGTDLKKHLNSLDTTTRQLLIGTEVDRLINSLSNSFELPINVTNMRLFNTNMINSSEINLELELNITERNITDNYTTTITHIINY